MKHRPFQAFVELCVGHTERTVDTSKAVVCSGRLRCLSVVLVTEANNGVKTGVIACQAVYCARLHESLGTMRLG
jgi:hypothetical protein